MVEQDKKIKSIYIHIPFCSNICSYCDFCKFYYNEKMVDSYLDGLLDEIKSNYKNEEIETLYIGGGTPSSLSILELKKLFSGLEKIRLSSDYEFTFECNILDLTCEKLAFLKNNRVNRLSIGIQSFQDKKLSFLERNYNKNIILEKVALAKDYFSNINVDLMYAVPGEDLISLKEDLELFLSLNINHISTYSLILEEHTKLSINKTKYIDEELDYKMYEMIHNTLKEYGFNHYEISNFSKSGYESKHNLTYWNNLPYYGFGLGASGYINDIRYTNTRNLKKYLVGDRVLEKEIVTDKILASNFAILGFRTIYGVSKKKFLNIFGIDLVDYFQVEDLVKNEILLENEDSYYINFRYWYVLNEILVKFI